MPATIETAATTPCSQPRRYDSLSTIEGPENLKDLRILLTIAKYNEILSGNLCKIRELRPDIYEEIMKSEGRLWAFCDVSAREGGEFPLAEAARYARLISTPPEEQEPEELEGGRSVLAGVWSVAKGARRAFNRLCGGRRRGEGY